jgi:hypothetical protein
VGLGKPSFFEKEHLRERVLARVTIIDVLRDRCARLDSYSWELWTKA